MGKGLIVAIVVVLLLITAAVGGLYLMGRSKNNAPQTAENTNYAGESSGALERPSLTNLLAMNGKQNCTFSDTELKTEGTVYMDNGKFQGEFSSVADGKTTTSHIISDKENFYMWLNDSKEGYRIAASEVAKFSDSTINSTFDLNKPVDYKCEPWSGDDRKFDLPKDITFQDLTAALSSDKILKPTGDEPSSQSTKEMQCNGCDYLPEESKAECRSALGC